MNLIEKSKQLKREAGKIIKKTKIEKFFSELGDIKYVGSYYLDLLFKKDIDFFVSTENLNDNNTRLVTKKLIDSKKFQTIGFADRNNFDFGDDLKGYYWEFIRRTNGADWKFDVWYVKKDDPRFRKVLRETKLIKNKLGKNPLKRLTILKEKQKLFDGEKYKNNITGFEIYKKVLEL